MTLETKARKDNENLNFDDAAGIIKDAIVRSRYQAAKLVNKELLGLYYAVGKYVSDNSRVASWGKGAIRQLSEDLQRELPGLRGFSEGAIKKMRLFYEEWQLVFLNRSLTTNDLRIEQTSNETALATTIIPSNSGISINLSLLAQHINLCVLPDFSAEAFYRVGFTNHYTIMAKEKALESRLFYISKCAERLWTVEALKSNLLGELYHKSGTMPNNFLLTLPEAEQACRILTT